MFVSTCGRTLCRLRSAALPLALLTALFCQGCGQPGRPPRGGETPVSTSGPHTVDSILDRTIKAYQNAKSYRDKAKIVMVAKPKEGDDECFEFDCFIEFERPNLLRLYFQFAYPGEQSDHVLVLSNGKSIYAKPAGFDNQVVVTPAPAKIEVPKFYEIEPIMRMLPQGVTGRCFALDLLTAKNPLEELDRSEAKLLSAERIDGQPYHRVQFTTSDGPLIFWINQETSVVRRVEYPTAGLLEGLKEQGVTKVELTTDFVDAALDPAIDRKQFTWQPSEGEHLVRQLVEPLNSEEAPSPVLGKPIPNFGYTTSTGEKRELKNLANGKVTVIDFWATWCGYCLKGMPGVDEVRKKYADNDQVQFIAMSVDEPKVTDADIVAALKETGAGMPWGRLTLKNVEEFLTAFEINGIPALIVLAPDGSVQHIHLGMDDKVMENLPPKIDALLKGENLAQQAAEGWEVKKREYERKLAEASIDAQASTIEIPRANIAQANQPRTLELVPLWTAGEVKSPGNLLVIGDGATKDWPIYVIDNMHEIVQLDSAGQVVARHQQFVTGDPPFTWIRTAVDKNEHRYFVLGAVGQNQFNVFDGSWKRLLSYPAEGSARIFDVKPADLDGAGSPQWCIGYYGPAGVQAVAQDGQRLWANRTLENVADLAVAAPGADGKRTLLCTHQGGTITPVRFDGFAEADIRLPDFAITHVSSADLNHDGAEEYCALAADASGARQIVGLRYGSSGGEFTWRRPIPSGEHERPIEMLTYGQLEAGQPALWIVAGADGSVHFFTADGTPVDQFQTGGVLTGFATTMIQGQPALLIAHPDKLLAYRVEKKT